MTDRGKMVIAQIVPFSLVTFYNVKYNIKMKTPEANQKI
jgi:hypothetical protein